MYTGVWIPKWVRVSVRGSGEGALMPANDLHHPAIRSHQEANDQPNKRAASSDAHERDHRAQEVCARADAAWGLKGGVTWEYLRAGDR